MSQQRNKIFAFGGFRLDADERVLIRAGEPIPLSPKLFQTLRMLVERHGHVISKLEIMDAVWPDLFVEESNLTQNIYILRRVLGADKTVKHFIENVPRLGYRFVAPVRVVDDGEIIATRNDETENDTSPLQQTVLDRGDNGHAVSAALPPVPEDRKSIANGRRTVLSSPWFSVAAIAVLFAALAFVGFRYFYPSNEETAFTPIENVNFQKLTFTGDLTFPVIAPDGNSFAFVRGGRIVVQDIASGAEMPLSIEGKSAIGILQFSPDSNSIYYRNRVGFDLAGSVFQVSRFGGIPKLVAENVWSGFGFAPDGKRMAFGRVRPNEGESVLIVKNLETGAEKKLAALNSPNSFLDNGYPAWSPDGEKIVVVVFKDAPRLNVFFFVDAETGAVEEIKTPQLWQLEQAAWLPVGQDLIISARERGKSFQLWRLSYPGGGLRKVTNDLNIYRGVSLSVDGQKLLARQFTLYSHLWTGGRDDLENLRQRTFGNLSRDGVGGMDWTPNGDIVYVTQITGDNDLWIYHQADDSRRQLTKNVGEINHRPTVSADGRYIYFNSNRSGAYHVWRMDASGTNQTQITFGEKEIELHPQISPDGAWLYYIQKSPAASVIWRKSLTNTQTEALTEAGKLAPDSFLSLSKDGKFLAFHNAVEKANEEDTKRIYQIGVVSTDNSAAPKFVNIAATRLAVRWASDGAALDYIENYPGGARIWRQAINLDQPPSIIVEMPKSFLHNFAWSTDGQRLVLSRGQQLNDAILLTGFRP